MLLIIIVSLIVLAGYFYLNTDIVSANATHRSILQAIFSQLEHSLRQGMKFKNT